MITSYRVQNFKQLRDVNARFGQLNILIGPNGAGKSSFLQSIDFLKAFMNSSVDYYLEKRGLDLKNLWNKKYKKTLVWSILVKLPVAHGEGERMYHYYLKYSPAKNITEMLSYVDDKGRRIELFAREKRRAIINMPDEIRQNDLLNPSSGFLASITEEDSDQFPDLVNFKNFILGIQTYLIWDPEVLRQRSRGEQNDLGSNGEHLASVLGEMKKNTPDQFTKMIRKLQKFLPQLEDISIKGSRGGWKEIILHERDESGTLQFNNRQISDGTLRLLAMAYLRFGNRTRSVVSFEEPENGVHPPILRASVQMIKEIAQLKPHLRSQIFMTTHSPLVLDMFKDQPESIYIMEKGTAETGAQLSQITEEQIELARTLFDNSLGNLWFSDFLSGGGEER